MEYSNFSLSDDSRNKDESVARANPNDIDSVGEPDGGDHVNLDTDIKETKYSDEEEKKLEEVKRDSDEEDEKVEINFYWKIKWDCCSNIPQDYNEWTNCEAVIWGNWLPQQIMCPQKCDTNNPLTTRKRIATQIHLNQFFSTCSHWNKKIIYDELSKHMNNCDKNIYKPMIANKCIHSCLLYRKPDLQLIECKGILSNKDHWVAQDSSKDLSNFRFRWEWDICKVNLCVYCIDFYADKRNKGWFRETVKDKSLHISHHHPLTNIHGSYLDKLIRIRWYGFNKKSKWTTNGSSASKYWVCWICKICLWDDCFKAPYDEFQLDYKATSDIHQTYFIEHELNQKWECSRKFGKWLKSSESLQEENLSSFGWRICSKYYCTSCAHIEQ